MEGSVGMKCVVLAGGPHDAIAAGTPGAPNKAFALVAGRTLLQISMEEAALADQACSILMGDDVEVRRRFIQQNAKDVRFLDF